MPTEAKREAVAELRQTLSEHRTLIVSEYRGLTVKEIAEIRRALRKQDVSYRVVKNRLLKIAAQDTIGEALAPLLIGPTAIAFGDDETTTAKAVIEATRPYKVVTITGGVLGDRAIDADGVRSLADPAVARGPAGEARRRDAGPDGDAGRAARREHPEPRVGARPGPRPEGRGRERVTRARSRRTNHRTIRPADRRPIDKET